MPMAVMSSSREGLLRLLLLVDLVVSSDFATLSDMFVVVEVGEFFVDVKVL